MRHGSDLTAAQPCPMLLELLQFTEFRKTQTIQCETGEQDYIYDISHKKCESIYETGVFKYNNIHIISDLKPNETITPGLDFAGSSADKSCIGSAYADHFGSWNNVFVQGTITIQLFNEIAQVNLDQDKIKLKRVWYANFRKNIVST